MPKPAMVYDVLIASPSDVREERNIVETTILRWNAANRNSDVILRPVRWERDAVPNTGDHAQAVLNEQFVDSCDLAIAIFWQRLGTPTRSAASGTIEEIERLRIQGKRVLVYFSDRPPTEEANDQQYPAVQNYRAEYGQQGVYQTYDHPADIGVLVFQHLTSVIAELASNSGRRAYSRQSPKVIHMVSMLQSEDPSRPEFVIQLTSLRKTARAFTPEFRISQIAGSFIPSFDWRMNAAGRLGPWHTAFSKKLDRTHMVEAFDLGARTTFVGDLWMHIRYHWNEQWHHERHRWPLRRLQSTGKELVELLPESTPAQYWVSDSPDDVSPPDLSVDEEKKG